MLAPLRAATLAPACWDRAVGTSGCLSAAVAKQPNTAAPSRERLSCSRTVTFPPWLLTQHALATLAHYQPPTQPYAAGEHAGMAHKDKQQQGVCSTAGRRGDLSGARVLPPKPTDTDAQTLG